ncbi:hypothetical protein HBI88_152540 [Parastagonospora nodorum]|nr:hypothetical protein HBI94_015760 [Parastagonospora nodorum]KAH5840628.1 hypothetical protein HBI93_036540 [Parastagonospora nodorum]KAH5919409.1 hypothetical protein HBI88_152540 [Parastagonospora nodorum]KAH5981474.1 hypothetical protein HBI86_004830 [Parastagonospora nodorum]
MNVFKEEFRVYQRTLGEEKNFNYPKWHALTHIIQDIRMYRALDSICTGANSEAYYITIIHPSIKCWRSSGKRHNDSEHCDEEVLYLILTIIDHTCYDKDRKHMAYIRAFSKVLLFNNNRQIDNTTRMLSVRRRAWNAAPKRWILQAFKFYDLSTIIRLVHLVLRDLPDLTTRTTISYYVNNYIDWDEYNRLYSPTFDIDLLRTLREYRRKRTRNN